MRMLYHFTSRHHLHGIGRYGLTVGDVPTDIPRWEGRCGVWLTTDDTATGHGLEGGAVNQSRYRLTVGISEDDPALLKWTEWSAKNVTPATRRALHATASRFDTWYVYFGVINPAEIAECVDMQTGLAVEDWRETPEGVVRPVPPERRHVWHKKLMKKLRRRCMTPSPLWFGR
jgi:hypothetical protein